MIVSIILNTHFNSVDKFKNWFLKGVGHAFANDGLLITEEKLWNNYNYFVENTTERFWKDFDIHRLSDEEYSQVKKGIIPQEVIESISEQFETRTQELTYLFSENDPSLESAIKSIIEEKCTEYNETVEGIFCCVDSFETLKKIARDYNCPLIAYSFAAVKSIHGYRETFYMAGENGTVRDSKPLMDRFGRYKSGESYPVVFSKKELLALLGKEKNMPMLPLLDAEGVHEMGICKTPSGMYPQDFIRYPMLDTDIYYEVTKELKTTDFVVRDHPNILWNGTNDGYRKEHQRNDPLSFMLSCKRLSSVSSMMLLKAMLWNRTVFTRGNLMDFDGLCEHDVKSLKKADDELLNFYMFAYLVPAELVFEAEYWRWRWNDKPSELEIYNRHMNFLFDKYGLKVEDLIPLDEEERVRFLLSNRGISEKTADLCFAKVNENEIDYEALSSSVRETFGKKQVYYCLNRRIDNEIHSVFEAEDNNDLAGEKISFAPFVDVGGFAKINTIIVDGSVISTEKYKSEYVYISKKTPYIEIELAEELTKVNKIELAWEYYFL